jgi:hypothetical protein
MSMAKGFVSPQAPLEVWSAHPQLLGWSEPGWLQDNSWSSDPKSLLRLCGFQSRQPGVNVIITIFGDFLPNFGGKMAFFLQTNDIIFFSDLIYVHMLL